MKSYAYLFWAYNVFWLGIAAWLFVQIRRLAAMDRKIDRLEAQLQDRK